MNLDIEAAIAVRDDLIRMKQAIMAGQNAEEGWASEPETQTALGELTLAEARLSILIDRYQKAFASTGLAS